MGREEEREAGRGEGGKGGLQGASHGGGTLYAGPLVRQFTPHFLTRDGTRRADGTPIPCLKPRAATGPIHPWIHNPSNLDATRNPGRGERGEEKEEDETATTMTPFAEETP